MMKYSKLLLLFTLLCASLSGWAQSVSVSDFHLDETDATANMPGTTVTDRNGDKCALLKIETTKTNFTFDLGSYTVQDVRQKVGQIWVYIPQGAKRITINNDKYQPCEFYFPEEIEKARTYVMQLIISEDMLTQRINITLKPQNAIMLLDGELVETTNGSLSMELLQGVHQYNVVAPGFASQSGTVVLNGNYSYDLPIELVANKKVIAVVDRYKPVQALPTDGAAGSEEEEKILEPRSFKIGDVEFTMMPVKGGTFMMGATTEQEAPEEDEQPIHQVTLYDYYIGETEVTQALWSAIMQDNPSYERMKGDNQPVEMVSYDDCLTFIDNLNRIASADPAFQYKFRLPTEAEWEYAAHGGQKSNHTQYSGANVLHSVGWGSNNSMTSTHDVKGKDANELGIYDMCGNVAEWCSDWKGTYPSTPQISPEGPISGQRRIIRGGSWNSYSDGECRVASRSANVPSAKKNNVGFRIVMQ